MIIGIDYGSRRIGIASSRSGELAEPHSTLRNEGDVVEAIAALGEQLGAETFVVGVPRRTLSRDGERRYRDFAVRLRQRTCKEVVLWDETLTTVEAAERLRSAGRSRRDAQREIDMHAAAVMLQSWIDAGRRSA
ncbi:MAG TPA: Holliday junction resolvase RuvX [Thermoanaerobaculia bacterium]|nr:Holliday junction resolvase RuvX [Thermoanaerobaculia bacterium]